eukprot:GDKK01061541.1.p1 GENE.GDKK01061541.1~~GDKK01061541.1.p1  ORF type:complete len:701 (-),score=12.86 GDKK01061541.1:86-2077(-)
MYAVSGTVKPLASSEVPKHVHDAKHNVQIMFSTPGTYIEMLKNNAFRVQSFPLPETCSTIFFDEVHHCASKHPYAGVATKIMQHNLFHGAETRMVGLTATLCYSRKENEIKEQITSLFKMLNAPFTERYDATEEELHESGVSKPPVCEHLNLYDTPSSGGDSANSYNVPMLRTTNPAEALELMRRTYQHISLSLNVDKVKGLLRCQKVVASEYDAATDVHESEIHIYTKYIYLLMRELEHAHPFMDNGASLASMVPMQELLTKAMTKMRLTKENLLTMKATQPRGKQVNPTAVGILGEALCCLYQAMRLIIASKQRELELAVRFLHKCRPVFEAAGIINFLDTIIPLENEAGLVFIDCKRVAESLASLAAAHSDEFRTIIFCEQSLAVAVLSDYLNDYFADRDDGMINASKYGEDYSVGMFSGPKLWVGSDFTFRADWLCSTGNSPSFNIRHRSTTEQEDVLKTFREGVFNVLCATTVVEEGLDVDSIRFIIHLSPPSNPVSHTQRSGRAREKDSHSVVLKAEDGQLVNVLRNVATTQHAIAQQLGQGEAASSLPVTKVPEKMDISCAETSAKLRAEMRKQYLNTDKNPVAALNELAQKVPMSESPCEKYKASQAGGASSFECLLSVRIKNKLYTSTSNANGSKKGAKNEAADKLLRMVLSDL